jgi:UDP-N-acetylmuramate-alanine ligase
VFEVLKWRSTFLLKLIEDDDVIITMGAGTIGSLPSAIVLASKQSQPEKSNRVEI